MVDCGERAQLALEISSQLVEFANADRNECDHDRCWLLDSIVLDCGMRIRREALKQNSELQGEHDR